MNELRPTSVQQLISATHPLEEARKQCHKLAQTHGGPNQIAAVLLNMILSYYSDVRDQASRTFRTALTVSILGIILFFVSVWFMFEKHDIADPTWTRTITVLGGIGVQVISGLIFWLYSRTTRQFAAFHICLERTNRYLIADSICETIDPPTTKAECRAELVRTMANAPMLTLDEVGMDISQKSRALKPKSLTLEREGPAAQ
jgi:hypothetical protein